MHARLGGARRPRPPTCMSDSAVRAGLVHYVSNPSCEPARILASFPNPDANGAGTLPSVLLFPDNVVAAALPAATPAMLQSFRAAVSEAGFLAVDPICAVRCGLTAA